MFTIVTLFSSNIFWRPINSDYVDDVFCHVPVWDCFKLVKVYPLCGALAKYHLFSSLQHCWTWITSGRVCWAPLLDHQESADCTPWCGLSWEEDICARFLFHHQPTKGAPLYQPPPRPSISVQRLTQQLFSCECVFIEVPQLLWLFLLFLEGTGVCRVHSNRRILIIDLVQVILAFFKSIYCSCQPS